MFLVKMIPSNCKKDHRLLPMRRKSRKQAFVDSTNDDLFRSVRRALVMIGNMGICRFTEASLMNRDNIVLLITWQDEDIKEFVYGRMRSRKYLNPISIIGYKKKDVFLKEHPLFADHPYNHCYLQAPFDLNDFVSSLAEMEPISSQAIRVAICGSDAGYKGYLINLLKPHDLLSNKKRCIEILFLINMYLEDKDVSKEINTVVKKIETKPDWPEIASTFGKKLESRIKGS